MEAQRATIRAEVTHRGWHLVELVEDAGYSAKTLQRPGMVRVLDLLGSGTAGTFVVAKLDRATRSVIDAANLLSRGEREGWKLCALDIGLDPSTPAGELVATIMAVVGQWERRAIGQRTRDALGARRAQRVRLGRPSVLPPSVVARIAKEHRAGAGWSAIARGLNTSGVATAHGGSQWYPSTVRAVHQANTRTEVA